MKTIPLARTFTLLCVAGLWGPLQPAARAAAPACTVEEISLPPSGQDTPFRAFAVNARGEVAGDNLSAAYRWKNGRFRALQAQTAQAINAGGDVVGQTADGRAYRWSGGTLSALPSPASADATSINRLGDVAGTCYLPDAGRTAPCWWPAGGAMATLPTAGNGVNVTGINANREIVGYDLITGAPRAVLWRDGALVDLGLGDGSRATAINDTGLVVGYAQAGDGFKSFLWSAGAVQDLGMLPGGDQLIAQAINTQGEIVGSGNTAGASIRHAFLWRRGVLRDLNTLACVQASGWILEEGWGISDRGHVVGWGLNPARAWRSFLLKPASATAAAPR